MAFLRRATNSAARDMEPDEPLFMIRQGAARRELKEQDLLRRLEECSGNNPDCTVDCTLKLGPSLENTPRPSRIVERPLLNPSPANIYGRPQARDMYGMMNVGSSSYKRGGTLGSSRMPWLPMNHTDMRNGFGCYGKTPFPIPATPNTFNNHPSFPPFMQQSFSSLPRMIPTKIDDDDDFLFCPRKCVSCETTSTPLWRNGPEGSKSLCNACGIRYKKEERRALGLTRAHPRHRDVVMREAETSKNLRRE